MKQAYRRTALRQVAPHHEINFQFLTNGFHQSETYQVIFGTTTILMMMTGPKMEAEVKMAPLMRKTRPKMEAEVRMEAEVKMEA